MECYSNKAVVTHDISQRQCLKLLEGTKHFPIHLLQIVYVMKKNLEISCWFFTNSEGTLQSAPKKNLTYRKILQSFLLHSLTTNNQNEFSSKLKGKSSQEYFYLF